MTMLYLFAIFLLALTAASRPAVTLNRRVVQNTITSDAPYSISPSALNTVNLQCPYGVESTMPGKNILLIHGTGGTGDESFASGLVPAFFQKGYFSCYVNLPNRTLGDAQVTSEYVNNAINDLYSQGGNKPFNILGHSQGNLNIQWTLNFFPTARDKILQFVSLAGDFQGTGEGPILSSIQNLLVNGTSPSVLQQSVLLGQQSDYLKALNTHGNMALVPTTSTYGLEDEIIQPVVTATSLGSGGAPFSHFAIQQVCPAMVVDHFEILINRVAFYAALDAFDHNSVADINRIRTSYPDACLSEFAPGMSDYGIPAAAEEAFKEALAAGSEGFGTQGGILAQRAALEPPLMQYAAQQQ